jgi:Zn finger protein HypA/HybF involved in hydrogenase expression
MGRKKGIENNQVLGTCSQCNGPAYLKTKRSKCVQCTKKNMREYAKHYMYEKYYKPIKEGRV